MAVIISAAIGAVGTIVVLFINRYFSNTPSGLVILKEQVLSIYEPLMLVLESEGEEDLSRAIWRVIKKNYSLTPPEITDSYNRLKNGVIDKDQFFVLVQSYFNWTRKQISYPYSDEKIVIKNIQPAVRKSEGQFLLAVFITTAIIAIALVYNQYALNTFSRDLASLESGISELEQDSLRYVDLINEMREKQAQSEQP